MVTITHIIVTIAYMYVAYLSFLIFSTWQFSHCPFAFPTLSIHHYQHCLFAIHYSFIIACIAYLPFTHCLLIIDCMVYL